MPVQLFSHNMQAYAAVKAMLGRTSKAAVIHPTGTGKSFIAFKWIEEHSGERFVWLSPSDYIFGVQRENILRSDAEYPMDRIVFLTYARLMWMTDEELEALSPYGIILDEFHRCGGKRWGDGVRRLLNMYPGAKLLGLSATKVRYLDGQRDMAEELFEGCVASEMTLGEAVVRGILPTPVYITTLYSFGQELEKLEARVEAAPRPLREESRRRLCSLRTAMESAEGLPAIFSRYMREKSGKYLVFCTSESHMKRVRAHMREWFGGVDPDMHCYTAYSADPETSRAFKAFAGDESDHLKLLLCINMLNEGVHVKNVSGVILFRPTESPIVYKQQIGRALTAGTTNTPLIFDVVNNFDSLSSYGTIQAEMDEAVERLRRERREDEIQVERFRVTEQVHDCVALFTRLESSLSGTWDVYFEAAAAYYAAHGDLRVPRRFVDENGLSLGLWIQRQRDARQEKGGGRLTQGQIERLNGIGMVWESRANLAWQTGYRHAQQYYRENGHLCVEAAYVSADGYRLGQWIRYMRTLRGGGGAMLSARRVAQLDALGMQWSVSDERWESAFRHAAAYRVERGNLDVPGDYTAEDGFALGHWLSAQRQAREGQFGRKSLTEDQIRRLDALGMKWETRRERQWRQFYTAAREYFDQNGNLRVPQRYETREGIRLGDWVSNQRRTWRQGKRFDERQYRLLEEIGMFDVPERNGRPAAQ